MIYEKLQDALEAHMQANVSVPPLQRENTRYELEAFVAFSRFTLLPAEPFVETIGVDGHERHRGLAQIDLFYPEDEGTSDANKAADLVMTAFKRGTTIPVGTNTCFVEMVRRDPAYRSDGFYCIPVVIRWRVQV